VEGTVNIGIIGDGTSAEGDLHDAMNAASVWQVPVVFCVTDNGVAIQTSPDTGRGIRSFDSYAQAFGLTYFHVDGFDFSAAYEGCHAAFSHVAAGKGPVFLHVKVPRLMGHSSAGDMAFRYDLRDPLLEMGAQLVEKGLLTEADIVRRKDDAKLSGSFHANVHSGTLLEQADARVGEIAAQAVSEPYPDPDTISLHVRRPFPEVPAEPGDPTKDETNVPYGLAIRTALERNLSDGRSAVWGQDVGKLGGVMSCTRGLATRHGDRCVDSPLNEPLICGTAFGASMHEDLWAFPEIQFGDYSLNCLHWFVLMGLWNWTTNGLSVPRTCVRMPVDPFRGGAVYHSMSLDGYFTPIPGLVITVPSTSHDIYGLLRTASEYEGPMLVLEPKILYRLTKGPALPNEPSDINATRMMAGEDVLDFDDFRVPLGQGVVRRKGSDLTIVAWGWAVHQSLEAAEELAQSGVSAEVIDLRTLTPYDDALVRESVERTGRLLVAHPDRTFGSFGRQVQADVTEALPGTPTLCVGMKNVPACTQCVETEDHIALQTEWITAAARQLLGFKEASTLLSEQAFVRADDPMAWVRFSSASLRG
ncbi:MAG: transketolase C-terminal domain-containing protein, partial [Acidobacteriota bacterium]